MGMAITQSGDLEVLEALLDLLGIHRVSVTELLTGTTPHLLL